MGVKLTLTPLNNVSNDSIRSISKRDLTEFHNINKQEHTETQ